MDFTGKRVLVTGGTRGIGRATAEAFLAAGARVALNGSTKATTAKAVAELNAGDRVIAAPGDVGVVEDCERIVAAAVTGLGGLDVLVNNAGAGGSGSVEEVDQEIWDQALNIYLRGTFFCIKYALPALRDSRGNVVNIASILGIRGNGSDSAVYCAAKGGVVNLTRELGIELAPEVRVNCICPGAIDTEMLQELGRWLGDGDLDAGYEELAKSAPLNRIAHTSELANVILFLASDLASFVTGSIHVADGGAVAKVG